MTAPREDRRLSRRITSHFISGELRRIRERNRINAEWVAGRMGWSASKISRIEHAKGTIDGEVLPRLLELVGATGQEKAAIMAAAENGEPGSPYLGASGILQWGPSTLPAGVQSPAYAWELQISRARWSHLPPSAAGQGVDASLEWQKMAEQTGLEIDVIFDESCLRRPYGGPSVMERQAAYLIQLADRDNVTIRMIPLETPGLPVVISFTYIRFPASRGLSAADMVLIDAPHGTVSLDAERETWPYHSDFGHLAEVAMAPDKTVREVSRYQRNWARQVAA
jgi:transcriptional regulator with XRE-family HTH domain